MPDVPRVAPFDRPATYDDLANLPDNLVGEIVEGELHASPRPAPRHLGAASRLGGLLVPRFDRPPDGGWRILDEPELHLGNDVCVPDIAGWRRERLPRLPDEAFFVLAPDWACEILSPSTAALDRGRKLAIYAREAIPHCWLIDPLARTLEVLQLESGRWTILATHVGDAVVRAVPFDAIDLPLGRLWAE